jgi:thiol:disulfide interchange protein DsbA
MKKLLIAVAGIVMLSAGAVQAQDFKEGVHYDVLEGHETSKPEIVEFFSFYCMACYRFEPVAEQIKSEHPDAFKKHHVNFISPGRDMGAYITQAYAAALALDKEDTITKAIYNANFVHDNTLSREDDVRDLFIANGVSGEEFDKAMKGFAVRSHAAKMEKRTDDFGIRGTPTFIVNGKYQMLPQGFRSSKDFIADFSKLATYLIEK